MNIQIITKITYIKNFILILENHFYSYFLTSSQNLGNGVQHQNTWISHGIQSSVQNIVKKASKIVLTAAPKLTCNM